jgi:hypothetical protein
MRQLLLQQYANNSPLRMQASLACQLCVEFGDANRRADAALAEAAAAQLKASLAQEELQART